MDKICHLANGTVPIRHTHAKDASKHKTIANINTKWIRNFNKRPKTIKLLGENRGKSS